MPATTLGSAPSMPATTMITRAPSRRDALREQAMQARDADVVQPIDRVAQQLGGHRRFFGHRHVRGAGAAQRNRAHAGCDWPLSVMQRAIS